MTERFITNNNTFEKHKCSEKHFTDKHFDKKPAMLSRIGLVVLLVGLLFTANAQMPYKHSIGVTLGTTQGATTQGTSFPFSQRGFLTAATDTTPTSKGCSRGA